MSRSIREKYDKEYIRYAQSIKDLAEIVDGFFYDLTFVVNGFLDKNRDLTIQDACVMTIEDSFWGSYHMHMFMHAFNRHRFKNHVENESERAGRTWDGYLDDFQEFMDNEVPNLLLNAWLKKHKSYHHYRRNLEEAKGRL